MDYAACPPAADARARLRPRQAAGGAACRSRR
jgi:hypothetical protein